VRACACARASQFDQGRGRQLKDRWIGCSALKPAHQYVGNTAASSGGPGRRRVLTSDQLPSPNSARLPRCQGHNNLQCFHNDGRREPGAPCAGSRRRRPSAALAGRSAGISALHIRLHFLHQWVGHTLERVATPIGRAHPGTVQ
jgi:hypothetical protein